MGAIFLVIASLVFVGYVLLAVYSTTWVQNRFASKWPARLTILFWVLLPTWDSILALGYHRYVCATDPEVGLHVYHTVKLDPKLFDLKTGKPLYLDRDGNLNKTIFGDRYKVNMPFQDIGHWPLMIAKQPVELIDTKTNTKIAVATDYQAIGGLWWSGFIFAILGGGISSPDCFTPKEQGEQIRGLLVKPFISDNTTAMSNERKVQ